MNKKPFPLVSIILPTFNQARYLPTALDSVIFQTYPNLEIIVCNHGSTDKTEVVVGRYIDAVSNEKVSWLHHLDTDSGEDRLIRQEELRFPEGRTIVYVGGEENIGGTASYNEGFKRARGKYCTYLVADDYFLPTAISEMVLGLESTGADVVYSDLFVVDDSNRILQKLVKPSYSFESCFADWFHLGVNRLYRRDLHMQAGYYDTDYKNANDYDMFLRFAMAGASFYHLPMVLYCTRKHDPDNPNEPASWRDGGYQNLMKESIVCAKRAREFMEKNRCQVI